MCGPPSNRNPLQGCVTDRIEVVVGISGDDFRGSSACARGRPDKARRHVDTNNRIRADNQHARLECHLAHLPLARIAEEYLTLISARKRSPPKAALNLKK
jgi:hypothetical protein